MQQPRASTPPVRPPQPQVMRGPIDLDPATARPPDATPEARPPAVTPARAPVARAAEPPTPQAAAPVPATTPSAPALDDFLRDYLDRVETPPPQAVPPLHPSAASPAPDEPEARDLGLNLLLADYVMSDEARAAALAAEGAPGSPPDAEGEAGAPIESELQPVLVEPGAEAPAAEVEEATPDVPALDLDELTSSLQAQLDAVADRDGIGPVALGQLLRWFDRAAIFRVQRGQVAGWRAGGPGIVFEAFDALAVPLDAPSPFLAVSQGAIHLGRIDESAQNRPLVDAMGGPADHAILVPVRLDDRVVAVVYGEAADEPAMEAAVIPCRILADMLGRTFRRIILAMREKTQP